MMSLCILKSKNQNGIWSTRQIQKTYVGVVITYYILYIIFTLLYLLYTHIRMNII